MRNIFSLTVGEGAVVRIILVVNPLFAFAIVHDFPSSEGVVAILPEVVHQGSRVLGDLVISPLFKAVEL